jgi:hypothetical protein
MTANEVLEMLLDNKDPHSKLWDIGLLKNAASYRELDP